MADLNETVAAVDEFDAWVQGIYQLEQEDLVLGGADGIDNLQAKQLLARSNWLKAQVLGLGAGKQPLDAMLTALSALVTEADQTLYFTGPDAPALTALTAFARTLIATADAAAARATLGAASPADIAAAIAALVNSSPATLDTLNELAAALGNDANFATTITNALALKAPLASPALTGVPTAPTAALGTNSTQLATTAFIAAALAAISDSSEATRGLIKISSAAEAQALTNDLKAITPAKLSEAFKGSNQSLAGSGYQKLPGGVIVQWGSMPVTASGGTATIAFPITFPTGPYVITASPSSVASATPNSIGIGNATTSSTLYLHNHSAISQGGFWIAIGK
ncbi:MAG: hypothetical protein K8F32_12325 [Rhodocyclaceae bacterium]|nr:hypothetical protein [Rhodocyclaceae bacterium]